MSKKQTPSDFLKQIIGRPVVVKLNSGVDYRGNLPPSLTPHTERCNDQDEAVNLTASSWLRKFLNTMRCLCDVVCAVWSCSLYTGVLMCLDGYMNIALEQTEEYVNGQVRW